MIPDDCRQSRKATGPDPHSTRVLVIYREPDRLPPYEAAVRAAGFTPVSKLPDASLTVAGFDALLLTGGTDVDPALYGESRSPETDEPDLERDAAEVRVLREALDRDIPILAICRGHQLLNVALGGTLAQHIEGHAHRPTDRSLSLHDIDIDPGNPLREISGSATWPVNSRHHQAISQLAPELRVAARDPRDQTIEAVYHPKKRFVLGVQWHPEDQIVRYPEQLALFRAIESERTHQT
jgi:putative glutamine amidotransferase